MCATDKGATQNISNESMIAVQRNWACNNTPVCADGSFIRFLQKLACCTRQRLPDEFLLFTQAEVSLTAVLI